MYFFVNNLMMKEAYIFVTKMLQIYNKEICWEMIKMIKIINSLKNSYKRKIMIFAVISLFTAFTLNEITNKESYIIYYENQPVGITKARPQVVYKAYGDAKAKFYSEGKNISDDKIYLEKTGKKYGNVKYIGENEISETIYSRLDDKEPILVGKSTQLFKYVNPYYEECEYVYDDTMFEDEIKVTRDEASGTRAVTVMETYYNGKKHDRKILETKVITKAVPRVVHIGTKKRPEYILPVTDYVLTSDFGPRWGTNHNGIDLAVPTGTDVMAAKDGTVIQAGWNGGYGISVYIDHGNGVVTRYGHMSKTLVSVGQAVKQGDIVGLSGSTGDSTGPHVHFEIREDGAPIDPVKYISY